MQIHFGRSGVVPARICSDRSSFIRSLMRFRFMCVAPHSQRSVDMQRVLPLSDRQLSNVYLHSDLETTMTYLRGSEAASDHSQLDESFECLVELSVRIPDSRGATVSIRCDEGPGQRASVSAMYVSGPTDRSPAFTIADTSL